MADRFEKDPADSLEAKRVGYAAARIADHAERELFLLERARRAVDADAARRLEYEAGTAHRDSVALAEEHGLKR
jgi:hypothetical protein